MASHKRAAPTQPLRVDYLPIRQVKPSKSNPKTHSPEQIASIVAMIKEVGWTKPIIVDEKQEILAGHGAYQAALQIGMEKVPTIALANLTNAQKKAYRIADNKLAEKSEWDSGRLGADLGFLNDAGYDMALTGFDKSEINHLLNPVVKPTRTAGEPPITTPKHAVSKVGDMWLMGDHRLICADSTKATTYTKLMDGRLAQCVFTDPPYGVSYEAPSGKQSQIKNDDMRRGELAKLLRGALESAMGHTKEDAGWYVWHADLTREAVSNSLRDIGLMERSCIIWEKPSATLGWSDYQSSHEPCFYLSRQGVKAAFYGNREGTTVWRIDSAPNQGGGTQIGSGITVTTEGAEIFITTAAPKGKKVRHVHAKEGEPILLQGPSETDDLWRVSRDNGGKDGAIHPTMKPVELAQRAAKNSTQEGDVILDMFAGACSTLIACELTGRLGYCIELDPKYVDASVKRWQELTGKQAFHAGEKKTFEAIAKARSSAKG